MRISDWSSDVCSSDLATSMRASRNGRCALASCDALSSRSTYCAIQLLRNSSTLDLEAKLPILSHHRLQVVRHPRHREDVLQLRRQARVRSEEHTSELQSLMRISYAVFCLKNKKKY